MEIVKGILAGVHFICAAHTLCSLANAFPPPLLADDPAMLLRESMGLASDGTHKAFPAITVDAFFSRQRIGDIRRHCDFTSPFNTNNILVAVDPSGGGASQFAVCSAIQLPNGTVVVLGLDLLRTKVRSPPYSFNSRGQFPRRSPRYNPQSVATAMMKECGFCAEFLKNRGAKNGRTRVCKSVARSH